ncbi:uncharacterized protein LOC112139785 [Oryzias melastigma]|uniref:uncharacterized protein LOC112139785 n=1 Tax=Oryzias melastigma TaxID=30732 RepID=UPI000CF82C88|nr:uncharacterized protein LOC112139785 [Oryzias melastigma]
MAMGANTSRAAYFTPSEIDMLLQAYADYEPVFRRKSNTAAAAKQRESAWEEIAARVNACNPAGIKRTWQQLKMKYKNIIQKANRKRADARKTGGGPAPPPLTEAEEMALSINTGRPMADGIPGGSSSEGATPLDMRAYVSYSAGNISLLEPPTTAEPLAVDCDDIETMSATERSTESVGERNDEAPTTSAAQMSSLPVRDLYRLSLLKQIEKHDKESTLLDRQIEKTDLEILILKHKLEEINGSK